MAPPPKVAPVPEPPSMAPPTFIPLALHAPKLDCKIRIELRRRARMVIKLVWLAAWARGLRRPAEGLASMICVDAAPLCTQPPAAYSWPDAYTVASVCCYALSRQPPTSSGWP